MWTSKIFNEVNSPNGFLLTNSPTSLISKRRRRCSVFNCIFHDDDFLKGVRFSLVLLLAIKDQFGERLANAYFLKENGLCFGE